MGSVLGDLRHTLPSCLFAQGGAPSSAGRAVGLPVAGPPALTSPAWRPARTPAAFSEWQPALDATEQAVSNSLGHGPRVWAGGEVP